MNTGTQNKQTDSSMKITLDSEIDALYIQFLDGQVTTQHLAEGIAVDYDRQSKLAGIEILDAVKRFGDPELVERGAAMQENVEQLLEVIGRLPEEKIPQVLDFARFLWWQETIKQEANTSFEAWAEKLAQDKGFANLSEQDVAYIVHESRKNAE
jgi:uncharacterized protein YuzE